MENIPVITHADDMYKHNFKTGDKFKWSGKIYLFYGYGGGTIASDYETWQVWNAKNQRTLITIPTGLEKCTHCGSFDKSDEMIEFLGGLYCNQCAAYPHSIA